jgi:hypothetical protein
MLKGTTKIELTDVNTGETQVIEKHNAITGALQELFSPTLGNLTDNSRLVAGLPAYTNFLGGLLLFDSRIEGDPLPLYAPAGVNLVGCARYNAANLSGSKYLGNYDSTESVLSPSTKMAKLVYNFTQSQANGTINSVCLTSRVGGYGVYKSDFAVKDIANTELGGILYDAPYLKLIRDDNDRYNNIYGYNESEHLYAIDIDNDIGYYFRVPSANKIVLVKRRIRITQYSMFGNTADIIGEPIEVNVTNSINTASISNNTYNFDPETNALYILSSVPNTSTLAVGASFVVTKIVLGESVATQVTLTNQYTNPINIQCGYVYRGRVYCLGSSGGVTVNGVSMTGYRVVSHSLNDNSLATHGIVTQASAGSVPKSAYAADGRIYWQASYSSTKGAGGLQVTDCVAPAGDDNTTLCGVDTIDYYTYNSSYYTVVCTPVLNHPMIYYVSSADDLERFVYMSHYLGTINNLATPIVKAPTQTMKITYTIQEV